jgi:hypothetical protein
MEQPDQCSVDEAGNVVRGSMDDPLGGRAGVRTAAGYLFCGNCSPEPLDYLTAVIMKVRRVGWRMAKDGSEVHVDVCECPKCGIQILR